MPQVQFGLSSYERPKGDLPAMPVRNMLVEQAPTEERGIAAQSRPGLTDRVANMGSNIRQLFRRDLVLGSALLGVSSGALYRETEMIGAVTGSGHVSMAGNEIGLMIAAGNSLHYYNGTTLSTVPFPDNAFVADVFAGGSRFWAVRKDTGKLYWTDALEANVDALDFATAESLPDRLLQGLWIDGAPILFGAESIEFWQQTGDPNLPIKPLINMVIEKGIRATGCATGIGHTFAAVTNENTVIYQSEKTIISNPGLQTRIEASATCSLFTFLHDGNEFLALRLDDETQVWNPASRLWSEMASYGYDNWLVTCAAGNVMGTSIGKTAVFGEGYEDFGGVLERLLAFGFPINSGGVTINNLRLRCNIGQSPFLTGEYADPQVEMRLSDDAGRTFDEWDAVSLGRQGEYREQPEWRALGMASQPAFYGQVRVTDPVSWRVSDILVNEPGGGR